MTGAICGGSGEWGRGLSLCPFCKSRRRCIRRLEMGGYGSRSYCGGCGAMFGDGEGRRLGKRDAAHGRALVKSVWPKARRWRVVCREELTVILDATDAQAAAMAAQDASGTVPLAPAGVGAA